MPSLYVHQLFDSKKFRNLKPKEQNEAVKGLKKAFENDISKKDITDQAVLRSEFYKTLDQKEHEVMGKPLLPKIKTYQIPQYIKDATLQQMKSDAKKENISAQDPPLQDSSLDFLPVGAGGVVKNLVVNKAAQTAGDIAQGAVDELTPQQMKDMNPNYFKAMETVAALGAGGMTINHALPKTPKQMSPQDVEAVAKHLQDTKPPKIFDTKKEMTKAVNENAYKNDANIKQEVDTALLNGATPQEAENIATKAIKITKDEAKISQVLNDGELLHPRMSGYNSKVMLENTINSKNPYTADELLAKLKNVYNLSDEYALKMTEAYTKKDPEVLSKWMDEKINNATPKEGNKITGAMKDLVGKSLQKVEGNPMLDMKSYITDPKKPPLQEVSPEIPKETTPNAIDLDKPAPRLNAQSVSSLDETSLPKNETDVKTLKKQTWLQKRQQELQDKFNRVKQLQKVKTGSSDIKDDSLDTYRASEQYHGRALDRVEKFQKNKVDPILKDMAANNLTIDDVDEYLHARHAIERNKQMKDISGIEDGSGMSDAKAVEVLHKYKDNQAIQQIASKVYDISKSRLKMMIDEGLEPKESIKNMENMYDNYVPLRRKMGDDPSFGTNSSQGFSVKGKEFKRAKGSSREVESPLTHTFLDYEQTINRAEKNRVGKTFLNFIEKYPDENLYSVENLKYTPQYTKDGLVKSLNPLYKDGDNIFHVKVDGKVKQIELKDKALAIGLKNLNTEQMGSFLKVAHKGVRTIATLATTFNPSFVVSNFERDIQTAMINMPKETKVGVFKFLKDIPSAIRGVYREQRGKKLTTEYQKYYKSMKAHGGTTGWMEQYEIPDIKKNLEKSIRKYEGKDVPRHVFLGALKYIEDINTAIENSSRLVAYKHGLKAGLTPAKSANIAKNLTVNFNKSGTKSSFLNTAYMFYNASAQGSVRMLQALKTKRGVAFTTGIAGGAYALHQYNIATNKKAYDRISDFEKNTNYIFMRKDGTYYKVKLPYGYNIFKVVGDISAQLANGELTKTEAMGKLTSASLNAFSPIGASGDIVTTAIPTLAKPAYEIKTNENFFGGKIKPEGNPFEPSRLAESQQYYNSVSPESKAIAQKLNEVTGGTRYTRGIIDISPEYMDHIAGFITSGLGQFVSRTAKATTKAIKGEKQDINQIPFLRLFVGKARDKIATNMIYKIYKQSSREVLTKNKVSIFKANLIDAIKNKEIDLKKAEKLFKKFNENQARAKWSQKDNIQTKKEALVNLGDALKSGVTESDFKKILKENVNPHIRKLIKF